MPHSSSPLLQNGEAASRLGVHPNTLRRWAAAGLIRSIRLPSGVRRFRPEEIDNLQDQINSGLLAKPSHPKPGWSIRLTAPSSPPGRSEDASKPRR